MHIVCQWIARVQGPEGGYAFINTDQGLKPIAGALEMRPSGRLHLITQLEARGFNGDDLIFHVPPARLSDVLTWFQGRQMRTLSVLNPTRARLLRTVPGLTRDHLTDAVEKFCGFSQLNIRSAEPTKYLFEIFDVKVSVEALTYMLAATQLTPPAIVFVSEEDIRSGKAPRGFGFNESPTTPTMLDPKEAIV